jgi:hypothetical protein
VNLTLGHHHGCVEDKTCDEVADGLYATLSNGNYNWPVSLLTLDSMADYTAARRTARKRAAHAERLGYSFQQISRSVFADDIFEINTSKPERQGRPMTDGYRRRNEFSALPDYPCIRHRIDEYGVLAGSTLVAYLVLYTCGDIALVSQILGHGDHEPNDIMFLLALGTFAETLERSGPVVAFYNRHDSGTDGLRYFKERLGFQPGRVQWHR